MPDGDRVNASSETGSSPALDPTARQEVDLAKEKAVVKNLELKNDDYAAEIEARRKYAKGLFRLVSWWIFSILVILLLQGFLGKEGAPIDWTFAGSHWSVVMHFDLSENIILALIGGTTAGVLGLFHIVAVHFFPEEK